MKLSFITDIKQMSEDEGSIHIPRLSAQNDVRDCRPHRRNGGLYGYPIITQLIFFTLLPTPANGLKKPNKYLLPEG